MLMKVETDESLMKWLNFVSHSENTNDVYISAMKLFCEISKLSPTQLIEQSEKELALTLRERSIFNYLSKFKSELNRKHSSNSCQTYLAAVNSFFTFYDILIPRKLLKYHTKPVIIDENDNHINEKILNQAFNVADELLKLGISIQYTSGLALSDMLNITVMQFRENIENDISQLNVTRQKTKIKFITFLSPTPTRLGLERIKTLNLQDSNYLISGSLERMEEKEYMYRIRKLSKEMELPHLKGAYNRFHTHNLRKMFYNTFLRYGGHEMFTLAEYFMGHKIPSTRSAYFKADPKALRKEYSKFVPQFEKVLVR